MMTLMTGDLAYLHVAGLGVAGKELLVLPNTTFRFHALVSFDQVVIIFRLTR